MDALIIGLYGVYLLMVGFHGHSKDLMDAGTADAPGFLPWAVSIAVLAVMYENDYTKKIAQPFIALLIVTFIVKNFDTLKTQFQQLYSMATPTK
jgi:hypothetical protein